MNNDKIKSLKTYRISEKDYAKSKRNKERLLKLKDLMKPINQILKNLKED